MKLNKAVKDYIPEDYLWLKEGEDCWVELDVDLLPDRDGDVFIRAKVKSINADAKLVTVDYIESTIQVANEVHLTRLLKRDPQTYPGLHDLVDLPVLNDAELHQKIRDRFAQLDIFTYIGPSLLIVNPFKYLPAQYEESLRQEFYNCIMHPATNKVRDKPPHVWAIAASAYLELFISRINQACCISGESGAGKTVNTKTCMSFLTGMNEIFGTKVAKEGEFKIEDKILMCNPILEALGNAKTVRNDNSSRFGKYVSLYIDGKIVVGASVESYLLEAIRVTNPNKSERNYHIFYQFLKGAKDAEISNFRLSRVPSQYSFLAKSGCFDVPTLDDVSDYNEHEKSMEVYLNYEDSQPQRS
jgi:myosin heavy subunit